MIKKGDGAKQKKAKKEDASQLNHETEESCFWYNELQKKEKRDKMETLRLVGPLSYAIKSDSIVDGEGIRVVLFAQGCSLRCKGCQNPETWSVKGGEVFPIDEIIADLIPKLSSPWCQGLTLSGGDPFLQDEAMTVLVKRLRAILPHLNVWAYSGKTYEELKIDSQLLRVIDVLVDGPFILEERYPLKSFRGSGNQRLICLNKGEVESLD